MIPDLKKSSSSPIIAFPLAVLIASRINIFVHIIITYLNLRRKSWNDRNFIRTKMSKVWKQLMKALSLSLGRAWFSNPLNIDNLLVLYKNGYIQKPYLVRCIEFRYSRDFLIWKYSALSTLLRPIPCYSGMYPLHWQQWLHSQ